MQRIEVTFAEAFLPRVAEAVMAAARPGTGKALECGNVMVVLPGRRAARRLVEVLAERALAERRLLIPPRVCTPQHLCEAVCASCGFGAIATEHEQHAAWLCALDEHRDLLMELMGRDDAQACAARPSLLFSLARTLDGVYTALAGERVTCDNVAAVFDAGSTGRARWQALGALVEAMRAELAARELRTLHDATEAALVEVQKNASRALEEIQEIIVAGIVDPFAHFTACVQALAERVTVMTYGPEQCGWFDECGALRRDGEIDFGVLDEHVERIVCADSAAEQAHAVVSWLREAARGHAVTDIVIGAPDAEVNRPLRAALALDGVAAHDAVGTPLSESSLGVLLSTLVEFIEERTWSTALQLLRHPVVEHYVCRTLTDGPRTPGQYARLVRRIETYLADHVVQHVTQEWPREQNDDVEVDVGLLTQALLNLLARFEGERALFEWIVPLNECLEELYSGSDGAAAAQDEEALRAWSEFSAGMHEARVQPRAALKATVALRQLMALAGAIVLAPPRSGPAVDIVGWLELALDDAPVVAVTGMNEGVLSESVTSDAFLPDGLRQRLGLPCNERRLQRDRYIVRTITGTGKKFLLTAGRASNTGDPLRISRVLCDMSAPSQARLMLKFYGKSGREDWGTMAWPSGTSAEAPLVIAPPSDRHLTLEITSLNATDFARYVACGYAFYLSKTVGEPPEPPGAELSPAQFGVLLHKVLEAFGQRGPKNSTNTREITAWLCEELARCAARQYGAAPGLAIELQLDSCRRRLAAFAEVQAARVHEGWQIVATEQTERDAFTIAGIPIVTRMDRIDQRGNEVVILDYKTGSANDPALESYNYGVWLDLQLPLYWLSVQASGAYAGCTIRTGYFNLPSKIEACEVVTTPWGEADYASALAFAEQIIARMCASEPGTFARTDNTAQCAQCPYRYLCQRV